MLNVLFKDAFKTPGKLVALCLVAYLATISFAVAGLVMLLAVRWLHVTWKKKVKAIEAAEAEAETARVEAEKLVAAARAADATKARVATVAQTAAAANDGTAVPAPVKQYAKSAVVVPFRTGIQ